MSKGYQSSLIFAVKISVFIASSVKRNWKLKYIFNQRRESDLWVDNSVHGIKFWLELYVYGFYVIVYSLSFYIILNDRIPIKVLCGSFNTC